MVVSRPGGRCPLGVIACGLLCYFNAVLPGRRLGPSLRPGTLAWLPAFFWPSLAWHWPRRRVRSFRKPSGLAPPPTARELTIPAQPALQPQALPPGAEALTVRLGGIAVEGGLPEFQRATAAITDPLVGQVVTAAQVFEAARAVNQLYADTGLVLVRVTVPPQNVVNGGTLRLLVINGMIERIDTSKVPEVVRARVDRMLAPLIGEAGLRLPVIERRLLLAGDMPGIALRSTLVPGETVGGAVLVVEGRQPSQGAGP